MPSFGCQKLFKVSTFQGHRFTIHENPRFGLPKHNNQLEDVQPRMKNQQKKATQKKQSVS